MRTCWQAGCNGADVVSNPRYYRAHAARFINFKNDIYTLRGYGHGISTEHQCDAGDPNELLHNYHSQILLLTI